MQEMIDAYLGNRLNDMERAVVETRIVGDPSFRQEVALTAAMREGLRELEKQGKVAPLLKSRTGIWPRSPLAIAASIMALALGVAALLLFQRAERVPPPLVLASLQFEQTRGADTATVTWKRPAAPTLLDMHFDVGVEPAASYGVVIEKLGGVAGESVLDAKSIPIGEDGQLTISMLSSSLEAGDYRIRLEPSDQANREPVSYILRIAD